MLPQKQGRRALPAPSKNRSEGIYGRSRRPTRDDRSETLLGREVHGNYRIEGWKYGLEDRLLQSNLKDLKGSIWISPEPKHGYARIRTAYALPSAEAFEAIDTIAKYVKSFF